MSAMQPHHEIELKWLLDGAADHARLAERLAGLLGPARRLEQRNRFYDTADRRLQSARVNLRLRCENGVWIVTCKQRVAASDGLHHHHEWERILGEVADPLAAALDGDLPTVIRTALDGTTPDCLGGFDNLRLAWDESDEEVCLDETRFPGRIDHELEVETTAVEACRSRWQERFATWGIAVRPAIATKFARFLALAGPARVNG